MSSSPAPKTAQYWYDGIVRTLTQRNRFMSARWRRSQSQSEYVASIARRRAELASRLWDSSKTALVDLQVKIDGAGGTTVRQVAAGKISPDT